MTYVVHNGPCCCPLVTFIQPGLSMLDITTENAIKVEEKQDVILLSIQLTTGEFTKEGVITINDSSMEGVSHTSWPNAIIWLNTTFKNDHNLIGTFNRSKDGQINYSNPERFISGAITPDYGVFAPEFGEEFN